MRSATLGLTERDLRAMRARRERNDDGTFDRVHLDRDAPEPYVMDGVLPPWYAKTCYKTVAVVAPDDGIDRLGDSLEEKKKRVSFVSVYDGFTKYAPGTTICHPSRPDHGGGLYVSRTIEGCLRRDRDLFPERSALLHAPRAIAKVRCWNPDRADEPVFYGNKLAFTCVHVDEILPYPTTWVMSEAEKQRQDDKSNNAGSPSIARYSPSVYSPSARTKTDSPSAELSSPGSARS